MKSSYKRLGDFIQLVDERNRDLKVTLLLGLSISKQFIPSVANIIGTDMANYKIIKKGQFACSVMQVRRDKKMPLALLSDFDEAIISQAYPVFEVTDTNELLPEYLMMWFSRSEFDRQACFLAVGGVRGSLEWEDFLDMKLPIPSIETQREIVKEYNVVVDRIAFNERMIQKLEETAQAVYKRWFVDFEFPDDEGKPYKSNGGEMVWSEDLDQEIPKNWSFKELQNISKMKYGKMLDSLFFLEKGYPVFSGYGIRGYHTEYMYESPQILVISRGVSGTGEVRLSPSFAYITNLSIIVEGNISTVNKFYLYFYLKNVNLRSLDSGSAQSQITTNDLGNFPILVADFLVQNSFGIYVENILNNINTANKTKDQLIILKNLLLAKMTQIKSEKAILYE